MFIIYIIAGRHQDYFYWEIKEREREDGKEMCLFCKLHDVYALILSHIRNKQMEVIVSNIYPFSCKSESGVGHIYVFIPIEHFSKDTVLEIKDWTYVDILDQFV